MHWDADIWDSGAGEKHKEVEDIAKRTQTCKRYEKGETPGETGGVELTSFQTDTIGGEAATRGQKDIFSSNRSLTDLPADSLTHDTETPQEWEHSGSCISETTNHSAWSVYSCDLSSVNYRMWANAVPIQSGKESVLEIHGGKGGEV